MHNSTLIIGFVLIMVTATFMACQPETPITYPPGGYDYPACIAAKDTAFYFCPLRKFLPRKDSFNKATAFLLFPLYNEQNLSIKPYGQDIFRFVYSNAFGLTTIISLTKNSIVIKTPHFTSDVFQDANKALSKTEQYLLYILQSGFPLDSGKYETRPRTRKKLDSLLKIYPQLRDVNYYWALECKRFVPETSLRIIVTRVSITSKEYKHLVSVINASGYWKMPYKLECHYFGGTDGDGFSLEANTAKKYNYVEFGSCTDNTPMQKGFVQACKELVKYAKMQKQIHLSLD